MKKTTLQVITGINDINYALLDNFRQGRGDAFSQIFQELYAALCFYGLQITGDQAVAEDIVEEAFIKIWERREMFHQYNTLKSYLYTIVRNESINWLKVQNRRSTALNDPAAANQQPEKLAWENLIQAEIIRELHAAINRLSPKRRKIFTMLYQEGKSVKEVAKELNISINTIKSHKKEGLIFLRKILSIFACLSLFQSW